jgi:hypothetical protein
VASAQTPSLATGSFLGRPSNGVVYVEWSSTASGVVGTIYTDLVQHGGGGKEQLVAERSALTWGLVAGDTINLSLASGATISGTLSGPKLILGYPVDNAGQVGTIIELPMHRASRSAYDQALTALRHKVASANANPAMR